MQGTKGSVGRGEKEALQQLSVNTPDLKYPFIYTLQNVSQTKKAQCVCKRKTTALILGAVSTRSRGTGRI